MLYKYIDPNKLDNKHGIVIQITDEGDFNTANGIIVISNGRENMPVGKLVNCYTHRLHSFYNKPLNE